MTHGNNTDPANTAAMARATLDAEKAAERTAILGVANATLAASRD